MPGAESNFVMISSLKEGLWKNTGWRIKPLCGTSPAGLGRRAKLVLEGLKARGLSLVRSGLPAGHKGQDEK